MNDSKNNRKKTNEKIERGCKIFSKWKKIKKQRLFILCCVTKAMRMIKYDSGESKGQNEG